MYLIFFDDICPLCNKAVRFILKRDKKKCFYFAPLGGDTAKERGVTQTKCLVLIHDEKRVKEGRAALRIFWLLGGAYTLIGWLSYLPPAPFDFVYRFIARSRYKVCKTSVELPFEGRLLP